jgi:hypothetical protein
VLAGLADEEGRRLRLGRIVPAEMRAERLAEENQRLVEERNRLLAMLKQQQAKTTQPAGGK